MAFEWNRIHKWEERLEEQTTERVYEFVLEFYDVEDVVELTEEQINEVVEFRDHELDEYSSLQIGFLNLISHWEAEAQWEEENDN